MDNFQPDIIRQVVEQITRIPALPVLVHRLLALLNDPESKSADIAKAIERDPALTANILKYANSAYFGFADPVNSINEAIVRVGINKIYQVASTSLIRDNIKGQAPGYGQTSEDLWKHATAVSIMTDRLCKRLQIKDNGSIYTAALIHDFGKIALESFVRDNFDHIQQLVGDENLSFGEAEARILGIDHAEGGSRFASNWNFRKEIVDIICWHHNPNGAEEISPGIDLVHIADAVCLMQGFGLGSDGLAYHYNADSVKRLGVTDTHLEVALTELIGEMEKLDELTTKDSIPTTA